MVGARLKMAKRPLPAMAGTRTTTKRKKRKEPTLADRFTLPRIPELDQHQRDVWGVGLVLLAVLFAFVFYFDWDGGKVGSGLAEALKWLFGGVAYLTPVALFAVGTLLVMQPLLPTVRPFKTGGLCLLAALMLGLAAQTFGLGPNDPIRHGAFAQPAFFKVHGGLVGESLFWVTRTLFSTIGADLIFVFLLIVGVMLLTGATLSGVIASLRQAAPEETPTRKARPVEAPEVEPAVVRQTHVEAPVLEIDDNEPVWEPEPDPEEIPEPEPDPEPDVPDEGG